VGPSPIFSSKNSNGYKQECKVRLLHVYFNKEELAHLQQGWSGEGLGVDEVNEVDKFVYESHHRHDTIFITLIVLIPAKSDPLQVANDFRGG
jgi:hypothetical protein